MAQFSISAWLTIPLTFTPLASLELEAEVQREHLNVTAVLSGNRNFEARVHPLVRAAYLASPPLVVANALAGTIRRDLTTEPIGHASDCQPIFLKDLWPSPAEVEHIVQTAIHKDMFAQARVICNSLPLASECVREKTRLEVQKR